MKVSGVSLFELIPEEQRPVLKEYVERVRKALEISEEKRIEIKDVKRASKKGLVCGIIGCLSKPSEKCSCGAWYCEEHAHVHVHKLKK